MQEHAEPRQLWHQGAKSRGRGGRASGRCPFEAETKRAILENRDTSSYIRYGGKRKEPIAITIEISRPEVEALILQRMKSGAFSSPEDVILHALRSSKAESRTGAALIAALQASPHKDIEIEPSRSPMPVRDVSL